MKKFISVILVIAVFVTAVTSVYFITKPDFPEERIYNYFENNNSANIFINLTDYLAVCQKNSIVIYDKQSFSSYTLADSVFDIEKKPLILLKPQGNTLYYICTDSTTGGMICCSFNVDTYEKVKIYTYKGVTNSNGFLGIENILGIQLVSNNTFTMLMNSGKYWLNSSGIHTYTEREDLLKKYDTEDAYGIYDGINKLAETDKFIFFVNFFGELIRFDKKCKNFSVVTNILVSDFFITENVVYYISSANSPTLYSCDYNGKNTCSIGEIKPEYVKFSEEFVYVADTRNIYKITDGKLIKATVAEGANWEVDEKNIYIYDIDTNKISTEAV